MAYTTKRALMGAAALSLGMSLAACGSMPTNQSLYSTNQPVVERTSYSFDVRSASNGLSVPEQKRLADWFEAMNLRYGDRVAIDDPSMSQATRTAIADLAARHGILVSDGAPVTAGYVAPGNARVVITRSTAEVPDCPNWSAGSEVNYRNATYPGYGCSVNGNLAAMVANPEDLIKGQEGTGETTIMSSTKAIETYRNQAPTGTQGLKNNGTGGG